jgi:hypothetical protein
MRKGSKAEWLSRLRLSKGAAVVALFAILAHAILPVGWMPAFAASQSQGSWIIICTSAGITHVQVGPDGQPLGQPASQEAGHNHQCCPCTGSPQLAPPRNVSAVFPPSAIGQTAAVSGPEQRSPSLCVHSPHSPRAPPSLA